LSRRIRRSRRSRPGLSWCRRSIQPSRITAPIRRRLQAYAKAAVRLGDGNFENSGVSTLVIEINLGLSRQGSPNGLRDNRADRISYLNLGERSVGDVKGSGLSKKPSGMTHLEAKLFSLLMVENYKQVIDALYHILNGPVVAPQRET
jgi:hypothetical protein